MFLTLGQEKGIIYREGARASAGYAYVHISWMNGGILMKMTVNYSLPGSRDIFDVTGSKVKGQSAMTTEILWTRFHLNQNWHKYYP